MRESASDVPTLWTVRRDVRLDEIQHAPQIHSLGREVPGTVLLHVAVELDVKAVNVADDVLHAARLQQDRSAGVTEARPARLALEVQEVGIELLKPHRGDSPIAGQREVVVRP